MKILILLLFPVLSFAQLLTQIDNQILHLKQNTGITIATGISVWADQSGNGLDFGQAVGGLQPDGTGGYATFDGTDEYLWHVDADIFSFTTGAADKPFSIIARINMADSVSFVVISKALGNTNSEWLFTTWTTGEMRIYLKDDNIAIYIARQTVARLVNGTWYVVGFSYDGSSTVGGIKMYINGVEVSSTDVSASTYYYMTNTTEPIDIGRDQTGTDKYSNGSISDILVVGDVLSPTEMANITTYFNTGTYPTTTVTATTKRDFGGWPKRQSRKP